MLLSAFLVALVVSAVLTRWTRDIAIAHRWVSHPTLTRHVHNRPIPRLGGIAIFLSLWTTVLTLCWTSRSSPSDDPTSRFALTIFLPCTLVFVIGLVDDFRGVNARVKVAVEVVAAAMLYFNGYGITELPGHAGGWKLGWPIGLALTIIWVLWVTNAFNLIDGLDGLAAGSALFSAVVTAAVALVHRQSGMLFLAIPLAGSIAGFLRYNFNPATIFLGDGGSLTIGFLFSALALAGSEKSPTLVAVAIPLVSLGLPIMEVGITVIRRLLSGRGLFTADRDHIHHKLLSLGISHRQAVLVLYGVTACFGLLSLFLMSPDGKAIGTALTILGLGVLIGVQRLRYHEFFELGRVANRTLHQRHIIANNLRIRRAAESFRQCDSFETLCHVLEECLQPIGFDGFSLTLARDIHTQQPHPLLRGASEYVYPFRVNADPDAAEWALSFRLSNGNGKSEGKLKLYRSDANLALLADVNVFTSTGFTKNLAYSLNALRGGKRLSLVSESPLSDTLGVQLGTTGGLAMSAAAGQGAAQL